MAMYFVVITIFIGIPLVVWLVLVSFYGLNFSVLNQNTLLKLGFWFGLILTLGGQFVFGIRLLEYWIYCICAKQIRAYFASDNNKRCIYRLIIPQNYDYDPDVMFDLMEDLNSVFKSDNVTWTSVLNYGKWHRSICFDYIVEKGEVECFMTIPFSKVETTKIIFKKRFPNVQLVESEDPFTGQDKNFMEEDTPFGYQNIAGSTLGFYKSNMYPITPRIGLKPQNSSSDTLIRYCKESMLDAKIIIQYVFTFDSNVNYAPLWKEFDELRQKMFERFAPRHKGGIESAGIKVLLPKSEKARIDTIEKRLNNSNNTLIKSNIKILAFCNNDKYIEVENFLDKAIRVCYGKINQQDNFIEKKYITSTNQMYYNHKGKNKLIGADILYDTFVFPNHSIEPFFSDMYNRFFYPNENRWRRQILYRTLIKRSSYGPISGSYFMLESQGIMNAFCIPTMSDIPFSPNVSMVEKLFETELSDKN